jgi:hypothetical protein
MGLSKMIRDSLQAQQQSEADAQTASSTVQMSGKLR